MKKRLSFTLFFILAVNLFAFEHSRTFCGEINDLKTSTPTYLSLKKTSYSFEVAGANSITLFNIPTNKIRKDNYYLEKGDFKIKDENGLSFINFNGADSFQLIDEAGLLHYGELLYLCKGNKIIYDSLFFPKEPAISTFAEILQIKVSSFLTENKIEYNGQNFFHYNRDLIPWVENASDEGIGEWIEFTINNKPLYFPTTNIDTLLISNGYVSFDKPYLYSANNRVKKIQIQCLENGMDFETEIIDNSQFQAIKFPEPLPQKKCTIRITIKDIYKGTKWNDTCINRILFANSDFLETGKIR